MNDELVILDFETTGLSPAYARVIEVAAIVIRGTEIIDTVSQLMHPGSLIPYFITAITGITNQMVRGKPRPEQFMPTLKQFIGDRPIVAHNASFDRRFLMAEMENIGATLENSFLCTLQLSRRLILDAPNHKLTTLTSHLKIKVPAEHRAHRALSDVMVTLGVWLHIKEYVAACLKKSPDFDFFIKLMESPKRKISTLLSHDA